MGKVRVRPETGRLYFDFHFQGKRCREQSTLPDTAANRARMEKALARIERDIANGSFDYAQAFPGSKNAQQFAKVIMPAHAAIRPRKSGTLPLFEEFAKQWKAEHGIEWRHSYRVAVDSIFSTHLLPAFGPSRIDEVDRAAVMDFRRQLAVPSERNARHRVLAPATINRVIGILRMIMAEAVLRHGTENPCADIRRLKLQRTDIQPFTLDEINQMLAAIRVDYQPYLTFRFFTGVRSAEAHGLKWRHVDFDRREVQIRETYRDGRTDYTKTDGSQRDLQVSMPVMTALMAMRPNGYVENPSAFAEAYIFHTRSGRPLDTTNFVYRVWKPLLKSLGIAYRRPYEMRHTCATLWLAAGEAPEWIARQLGHTTTEMLFRTYSRYVPNLVRRDGTAFDHMIAGAINGGVSSELQEAGR